MKSNGLAPALLLALTGALIPAPAAAQFYVASQTGVNHTLPATVRIDQPAYDRTLVFDDVHFLAKPFKSPQYYDARIGYMLGRRLGFELEFLHQKVISDTDRVVHLTGRQGTTTFDLTEPMNVLVQHYSMTHGLNFWMANLVWRTPIGGAAGRPGRVSLVVRGGGGPVMPGVDTIVGHVSVQHYQYSGFGGQAAAGLDIRVSRLFSLTAEYKLTYAKPRIDVDGGTGRTTTLGHHLAAGFAIGFGR